MKKQKTTQKDNNNPIFFVMFAEGYICVVKIESWPWIDNGYPPTQNDQANNLR
jgi:hypothetical protein